MIGKAYFYKGEFDEALKTFLFIVDEFKKTETAYGAKIFALRAYSEKNDFLACEGVITELNKKRTLNKKTNKQQLGLLNDLLHNIYTLCRCVGKDTTFIVYYMVVERS